jgi:hypothetical protein
MADMSAGQLRVRAVLKLVDHDLDARQQLIAAYTGQGDALAALREAADDTSPALPTRLIELRRTAFGRTNTPAEEHAAAEALTALNAEEARRATDATALLVATAAVEEWAASRAAVSSNNPESPSDMDEQRGAEPTHGARRWALRPLALASVILGSMAIGAMAATLWTNATKAGGTPDSQAEASARPPGGVTNVAPGTEAIDAGTIKSTGPGSSTSAEEWFQKPAKAGDVFPNAELIDGLNASSTRLVGGTPKNLSLWVGKTNDDGLCLIMSVPSAQDTIESMTSCASRQQFDATGLGLHTGGYQAVWTGPTISVFSDLTPRSD